MNKKGSCEMCTMSYSDVSGSWRTSAVVAEQQNEIKDLLLQGK